MSEPPFHQLNTSFEVGDRPDHVAANLNLIQHTFGARHLLFLKQTHGTDIISLRSNAVGNHPIPAPPLTGDAIITDIPGLAILTKQADCQGVILFDPERNVVANVHCGWRGNVSNILGKAVAKMVNEFGCRRQDLMAGIGPSLGPCCAEFVGYRRLFPESFVRFQVRTNHFNLQSLSRWQLQQAGLRKENIETAAICTRCRTDLFFSYRGEAKTGRFGSVVMLKPGWRPPDINR